jgi:hypothetical protein
MGHWLAALKSLPSVGLDDYGLTPYMDFSRNSET